MRRSCRTGGVFPSPDRLTATITDARPFGTVDSMIEISELSKRYGPTTAVSDLTFTVRPGTVTGFLGPNGAGKSTTMRMILGVDEVIDAVGLRSVAGRPAGKFSLGMAQRLGIAAALLGDPATVVLDEPVNGLDVEGIRWMRGMLSELAGQGKTVFVSSHLMSEIAQTATRLIVIGKGRLIADTSVADFIASAAPASVRVRSSDQPALAMLLRSPDVAVTSADDGALLVSGLPAERIGTI